MNATLPALIDEPPPAPAPIRFDDITRIAAAVSRSRLYGLDEAQALTLMLLAHSRGLHPIQAVERYHVIQGKPAMKADAMLAEFQSHGGVVTWHRHDAEACEATFAAPNVGEPVKLAWTLADAKRAQLLSNPMWGKYPRQMLRARVISEGIRMTMPGIVIGVYTPEEVADFEPAPAAGDRRQPPPPRQLQSPPKVDNQTGHGSGKYAAPEDVARGNGAIGSMVEEANATWVESWMREHEEMPSGVNSEVVSEYQLIGHLVKWGLLGGHLADVGVAYDPETGKPVDRVRPAEARKYLGILWARHRDAMLAEARKYIAAKAKGAWDEWHAQHEPDPGPDPEIDVDGLPPIDPGEAGSGG